MMSWNDDDDKKPTRSGSLRSSLDYTRPGSTRKSADYKAPTRSCLSPASSVPKDGSTTSGSSLAPPEIREGEIGAAGWWHNMDHGHLNERPEAVEVSKPGEPKKSAAFVPQFNVTGQAGWGSSSPTAASSPPAPVGPPAAAAPAPSAPPAPTAAVAAPPAASAPSSMEDQIKKQGWWTQGDNSILNAPPEAAEAAGAARKGSSFVPQFNLPGMAPRYGAPAAAPAPPVAELSQAMRELNAFDELANKAPTACAPVMPKAGENPATRSGPMLGRVA